MTPRACDGVSPIFPTMTPTDDPFAAWPASCAVSAVSPRIRRRSVNSSGADFLRRRIKRKAVEKDFNAALVRALKLAKGEAANYLPGWCGPVARMETHHGFLLRAACCRHCARQWRDACAKKRRRTKS